VVFFIPIDSYGQKKMQLNEIIQLVRNPAGKEFTKEEAERDPAGFLVAVHGGLKNLHMSLISEMMVFEFTKAKFLEDSKAKPMDNDHKKAVAIIDDIQRASRRANDAIAWVMLGFDRNSIKRLCYRNPRGNLKDQNPGSAIRTLNELNSDPYKLAIWTDATTSVNVGDILLSDLKKRRISCIELKEGKINRIVHELLDSGTEQDLSSFLSVYGDKGRIQLGRVVRQRKKYLQTLSILKENRGIDPITEEEIRIASLSTKDEHYFPELDALINEARKTGSSMTVVDDCLWLCAFVPTGRNRAEGKGIIEDFSKKVLSSEGDSLAEWLSSFSPHGNSSLYPVFNLKQGLNIPESMPIYLYGISEENIHDIIMDKILVLSFLSWPKYASLFRNRGFGFAWSSKKEGRREISRSRLRRGYIVGEQIPVISKERSSGWIGPGTIIRIIHDCVTPLCVVQQFLEGQQVLTSAPSAH